MRGFIPATPAIFLNTGGIPIKNTRSADQLQDVNELLCISLAWENQTIWVFGLVFLFHQLDVWVLLLEDMKDLV